MADLPPNVTREIVKTAETLRARFTPPEFIPGCEVKSISDIDQYATNNGWIEALCGQHNQQRVRYKGFPPAVGTADYVDVLYFRDRRLFEVYGWSGTATAPTDGQYLLTTGGTVTGEFSHTGGTAGFFGATPTTQPAALTGQLTTITHSAPGTADFAIADPTAGGYGFTTLDEALTVLDVIENLQARVQELEDKLQALGLLG